MPKSIYSLFGDKKKGYKRFLYNPYLPRSQNQEGCIFDLTAEMVQHYYDLAWNLTNEVCETLVSALGDGHKVWPVDRFLITSMVHAILYGDASGKFFLSQHGDEISSFVAKYHRPDAHSMSLVGYLLAAIDPGLVERVLCTALKVNNIHVTYESGENTRTAAPSLYRKARAVLGEVRRSTKLMIWAGKSPWSIRNKPLLIYSNGFLEQEELEKLSGSFCVFSIEPWVYKVARRLQRRVSSSPPERYGKRGRELWRNLLRDVAGRYDTGALRQLLPLVVDIYPVSLLEERVFLVEEARRFVNLLRTRVGNNRIVLSIDHRICKSEWAGALAQKLLEEGSFVVGQHHGPNGHWRCHLADSTEQILRTHYASISKRPFVRIDKESPEIIPVALPRKFYPVSKRQLVETKGYSIWFFPHYLGCEPEDGIPYYFLEPFIRPENYFERTTSIMSAFMTIACNPKVKEIVIKPKADKTRSVDVYRRFITELVSKDRSGKIRLADRDMTMPEALSLVSIAVHDIFSTGALQTILFDIPTIVLLTEQEEVPENLRYFDQWVQSGVFVKDAEQLASALTRWIASDYKLPKHLSQTFKEDWGGSGNPTIEEELGRLLLF